MINVRVQFVVGPDRVYWTAPIRNPQALAQLVREFDRRENRGARKRRKRRARVDAFDDDEHALVADACLEIGRRERTLSQLIWGGGKFVVDMAPLPRAVAGSIPMLGGVPVVGGFPLLDQAPAHGTHQPSAADSLIDVLDEELPSEPPHIVTHFEQQPVKWRSVAPMGWLDRLIAWVFGWLIP